MSDQIVEHSKTNQPLTRLPEYLRRSVLNTEQNRTVRGILKENGLNTICESGRCPNKGECFANGTATFLLMGSLCTRTCKFCSVNKGRPQALDENEPQRVAQAVFAMKLNHIVLTSVNRDDLPDQGSNHFVKTIEAIRLKTPHAQIEILTPDFQGKDELIKTVLQAKPAVFNHNVETIPRLYKRVRPGSIYKRSLHVLKLAKKIDCTIPTKSGLMLGLGETMEEVKEVLQDLLKVHCDMLTLGQYLQPSRKELPVVRYLKPYEFDSLKEYALSIGFQTVHAGPLVRSSYHAKEVYNNT